MANLRTAGQREQRHRKLDAVLDRLPCKLEDFREAQEQLQPGIRQLAQASMQRWAESPGTASPPSACPNCGYWMRHRSLIQRTMVTLHGVIRIGRPRRRCDRCGQESYRHDEEMCFAWHGVSWCAAAKVSQWASLLPSYELARGLLAGDYGIELSNHSIEQIVLTAGEML